MMRPRVSRTHSALLRVLFAVVASAIVSTSALAQSTIQIPGTIQPLSQSPVPAITQSALAEVLDKGQTFETERRWGEAFALYEEAVRKNPGQPDLERRLDLAKMHFDVSRRYADASFRESIVKQSDAEALATYTDAATKVQSHYVLAPEWARLVGRGNMNLEIALSEPMFLENNLPGVSTDRIDRFVTELRRTMSGRRVGNRNDARETVWAAAYLANTHLGLRPSATIMEYTAGMLGGLDEYSTFLTSGQLNDLYSQIEGNFVGLGVELKADDGALLIVNVVPKSPAQRAGIKPGDRIIEVAGRSTQDVTTDQAAELLQGEEGSYVKLIAVTPGQSPRTLTIRREHVEVPSVENAKIVDPDFGIAYFKLSVFQKTTAQEVDTALWDLHRQGMRSLIIDLRRNPGGLLTSGVEVADRFVEQGSIVSTRGRSAGEDFNYTAKRNGTWRVPLVVLIDGDSASAAEILAGALRDHRRATIVGERSYGKGSVQSIFQLSNGGAGVRLTTAKFYSPLGKPFSRVGVEPEIAVQTVAKPVDGRIVLPVSDSKGEDDAILNAGIQAARRQVAQK